MTFGVFLVVLLLLGVTFLAGHILSKSILELRHNIAMNVSFCLTMIFVTFLVYSAKSSTLHNDHRNLVASVKSEADNNFENGRTSMAVHEYSNLIEYYQGVDYLSSTEIASALADLGKSLQKYNQAELAQQCFVLAGRYGAQEKY